MGFFDGWFGGNKHSALPASDLEFFNSLHGKLEIVLSAPPHRFAPNLANLQAPPDAKVIRFKLGTKQLWQEPKIR